MEGPVKVSTLLRNIGVAQDRGHSKIVIVHSKIVTVQDCLCGATSIAGVDLLVAGRLPSTGSGSTTGSIAGRLPSIKHANS